MQSTNQVSAYSIVVTYVWHGHILYLIALVSIDGVAETSLRPDGGRI